MIIGKKEIDYKALRTYQNRISELVDYVDKMIPNWAYHIKGIHENQRYYVAIHLRNVLTIPYKVRKEMLDTLIRGINISGKCDCFIDVHDIVLKCNTDVLRDCLKEKIENGKETL